MCGRLKSATLIVTLGCGPVACGPSSVRPAGAEPARIVRPTIGAGPAAPQQGLPIPDLAVDWSPPRVVAGSVEALAAAMQGHEQTVVRLGTGYAGDVWALRTTRLLQQLQPGQAISVLPIRGTDVLLGESSGVLRRDATEVRGVAPTYAGELVLQPNWRASVGVEGKAGALFVLDDPSLDATAWAALPARSIGSCGPALDALAAGQEQSLAYLETFLDHADDVLWAYFRSELNASLPDLLSAHAGFAADAPPADADAAGRRRHACGHADWVRLQRYDACLAGHQACPVAPRVFLIGGARIGTAESAEFVDQDCAAATGRDVPAELRQLSREAAGEAVAYFDPDWVALADRLGTLTEVHDALEDICTPRRRRFAPADLHLARERLAEIGLGLASDAPAEPAAMWTFADASFFVPGTGPVTEVARFNAGQGSVAQDIRAGARGLRQFLLSRALCRSGYGPTPLLAAVVDLKSGTSTFASYFYEEELFCADLPPSYGSESEGAASDDPPELESPGAAPPP